MTDDTPSYLLVAVKSDEECSQSVATATTHAVEDGDMETLPERANGL